jgi:hypothetical protein
MVDQRTWAHVQAECILIGQIHTATSKLQRILAVTPVAGELRRSSVVQLEAFELAPSGECLWARL